MVIIWKHQNSAMILCNRLLLILTCMEAALLLLLFSLLRGPEAFPALQRAVHFFLFSFLESSIFAAVEYSCW